MGFMAQHLDRRKSRGATDWIKLVEFSDYSGETIYSSHSLKIRQVFKSWQPWVATSETEFTKFELIFCDLCQLLPYMQWSYFSDILLKLVNRSGRCLV
jgi:hypothetical protein